MSHCWAQYPGFGSSYYAPPHHFIPARYLLAKKCYKSNINLNMCCFYCRFSHPTSTPDWHPWCIDIFLLEPTCRHSCCCLNIIRVQWTVMPAGLAWTATGGNKYLTSHLQRGNNKSRSDPLWNPEAWRGAVIYVFFYENFPPLFFRWVLDERNAHHLGRNEHYARTWVVDRFSLCPLCSTELSPICPSLNICYGNTAPTAAALSHLDEEVNAPLIGSCDTSKTSHPGAHLPARLSWLPTGNWDIPPTLR